MTCIRMNHSLMRQFLLYFLTFSSALQLYAQTIDVSIDWDNAIREIPDYAYGVNSPANFIPSYSNDPIFMGNLELITQKKGFVRLHGWGMIDETSPESWLSNGVWNSSKINQALAPLIQQGYQVMINVPSGALGEDDYLNAQEFAQFCADLVQIVNIDFQLGVEYWEIPNEREQGFATPGLSVNEMSTLIQTASQAMKAVDPTIKVGGATAAWVNVDYLTQLVQMTPDIDFITCHTYSGDCTNSLQDIYDVAQNAVTDLNTLRQNINTITGTNYLPIFLTEYNLSFQGCDYIQSYEGAVYDAIIMTESIKAGIDGTCYWAIAPYSDMSIVIGDVLDDNAYLFESFNTYFHGDLVQSTSSDNSKIVVYSTKDQLTKNYSFCLINRTASTQNVRVQMTGTFDKIDTYLWNAQNSFRKEATNWSDLNNGDLVISPYSVNIFNGELNELNTPGNLNKTVLFPNPSTSVLNLSNAIDAKTFKVFSQSGALIECGKIENSSIDVTNYASGIYFVVVLKENGSTYTLRVIKR